MWNIHPTQQQQQQQQHDPQRKVVTKSMDTMKHLRRRDQGQERTCLMKRELVWWTNVKSGKQTPKFAAIFLLRRCVRNPYLKDRKGYMDRLHGLHSLQTASPATVAKSRHAPMATKLRLHGMANKLSSPAWQVRLFRVSSFTPSIPPATSMGSLQSPPPCQPRPKVSRLHKEATPTLGRKGTCAPTSWGGKARWKSAPHLRTRSWRGPQIQAKTQSQLKQHFCAWKCLPRPVLF